MSMSVSSSASPMIHGAYDHNPDLTAHRLGHTAREARHGTV